MRDLAVVGKNEGYDITRKAGSWPSFIRLHNWWGQPL